MKENQLINGIKKIIEHNDYLQKHSDEQHKIIRELRKSFFETNDRAKAMLKDSEKYQNICGELRREISKLKGLGNGDK